MTGPVPALDWRGLKAVIFDVDGTMYNQKSLRLRMMLEILRHVISRPAGVRDILIVRRYRLQREHLADQTLDEFEESLLVATAASCRATVDRVRSVVQEWIHARPLRHLMASRAPGLVEFITALRSTGVAVAVFSDYPSQEKLRALGVAVDTAVCSSDAAVGYLKPDPRGLLFTCGLLGRRPAECVFIGDRDDRDGECARRANMPYLIFKHGARRRGCVFGLYSDLLRESGTRA